jgi:hypothetical protein
VTLTFDLWPWKSIGFQTLLMTKFVPSLVKIHSRILILECSQGILQWIFTKLGTYLVLKRILKPIDFQGHVSKFQVTGSNIYRMTSLWTLLMTKFVPSLVKIHSRILILECSQGCYALKIWPGDLDLWPWKSIGFQTLLRTMYGT